LALRLLRRGGWINVESFAATANELSNIESPLPQCLIQRQKFPGRHVGMTGDRVLFGVPHNPKEEEESNYSEPVQDGDGSDRKVVESTINIPDMNTFKTLNPEVASIMELHEKTQRYGVVVLLVVLDWSQQSRTVCLQRVGWKAHR
jgi:hypothetical protein